MPLSLPFQAAKSFSAFIGATMISPFSVPLVGGVQATGMTRMWMSRGLTIVMVALSNDQPRPKFQGSLRTFLRPQPVNLSIAQLSALRSEGELVSRPPMPSVSSSAVFSTWLRLSPSSRMRAMSAELPAAAGVATLSAAAAGAPARASAVSARVIRMSCSPFVIFRIVLRIVQSRSGAGRLCLRRSRRAPGGHQSRQARLRHQSLAGSLYLKGSVGSTPVGIASCGSVLSLFAAWISTPASTVAPCRMSLPLI